jgi:hypothetical protein
MKFSEMSFSEMNSTIKKLRESPVNDEAHQLLTEHGWKLLGTDDESGYQDPFDPEGTLIVSRSGAWRHIIPTSYMEHIDADGLPDELEDYLKSKENSSG